MIYLDNSATTPVSEDAATKMREAAVTIWGNPSSLHNIGLDAKHLLDEARANILKAIGVTHKEGRLIFTGSGTEANNLALFGTAYAKKRTPLRIITDDSQHASVMRPLERLEEQGFEIVRIPTRGGSLDLNALESAVSQNTLLVTLMLVNNETGAMYDVAQAFRLVKRISPNTVTHTDAIQAFMKIPFNPISLHADLISVSGHKVHAPKGIGALYVGNDVIRSKKIVPYILGGGQEDGFRSGTENLPCAAAFGEAVKQAFDGANAAARREQLIAELPDDVHVNLPAVAASHIISLTLPSIKSETMLHYLSSRGIYVSSGSACSSNGHKSGALTAFGLSDFEADCTIRVSLGGSESSYEIDTFTKALSDGVNTLIRI